MAKLIVALVLLSNGLANGLANFGGCTCEVARSTRSLPASRVRCFLLSEGLNHYYVAQVKSSADGIKITNTGTAFNGGPVAITARALRPSARPSENLDNAPLARRTTLRDPTSR